MDSNLLNAVTEEKYLEGKKDTILKYLQLTLNKFVLNKELSEKENIFTDIKVHLLKIETLEELIGWEDRFFCCNDYVQFKKFADSLKFAQGKKEMEMFELTTGEMIDQLQYNEIALNDIFGTYVIRKSYGYMWCDWQGNIHRDKYFVISDMVKDTKWKILQ